MTASAATSHETDARRLARAATAHLSRNATDDEILGLLDSATSRLGGADEALDAARGTDTAASPQTGFDFDAADTEESAEPGATKEERATGEPNTEPENLRAVFDAHPEARRAWRDAQAYRETFATPEEARAATALLADLDRMDALFFSRRPGDHAELARAVAQLDPAAFASLARAINDLDSHMRGHGASNRAAQPSAREQGSANGSAVAAEADNLSAMPANPAPGREESPRSDASRAAISPAQAEFFHEANAAAVQSVIDAIESQVERLLPEGVSKSARNRVVGEIYRELDNTLRSNRQLAQQMREAFRSGALDDEHRRAIVSLVTGRARQALPAVAKRVLNEWTSTIVAANQDRRTRQRAAERRVDIAGSGGAANDGRRPLGPRDIDYARMSDSDILNL
jgi:hypothetical protein